MTYHLSSTCHGYYRQMGELWTLSDFAHSLHHTRNMVVKMDGTVLQTLSYITIFPKLRVNAITFVLITRKNMAVQSYPCIWGNFGRTG